MNFECSYKYCIVYGACVRTLSITYALSIITLIVIVLENANVRVVQTDTRIHTPRTLAILPIKCTWQIGGGKLTGI